jgi:hypothetical protein
MVHKIRVSILGFRNGPLVRGLLLAAMFVGIAADVAAELSEGVANGARDLVELSPVKVIGSRMEDFGFRVSPGFDGERSSKGRRIYTPVVDVVLPNTAGSRAGLRPGDRILKADGKLTASGSSTLATWRELQEEKWQELATGEAKASWNLLVETAGTGELRTLELRLPTPAPHWGSGVWQAPRERAPVTVPEAGILAERAAEVLNNGIWVLLRGSYVRGFRLPVDAAHPNFLCYQWTLWRESVGHRMYVSQQRGRTDIIFEVIAREGGALFSRDVPGAYPDRNFTSATTVFAIDATAYLTSPSGALETAWRLPRNNRQQEIPTEAARAGFEREVEFWTKRVGKSPGLWPLMLREPVNNEGK